MIGISGRARFVLRCRGWPARCQRSPTRTPPPRPRRATPWTARTGLSLMAAAERGDPRHRVGEAAAGSVRHHRPESTARSHSVSIDPTASARSTRRTQPTPAPSPPGLLEPGGHPANLCPGTQPRPTSMPPPSTAPTSAGWRSSAVTFNKRLGDRGAICTATGEDKTTAAA